MPSFIYIFNKNFEYAHNTHTKAARMYGKSLKYKYFTATTTKSNQILEKTK